MSACLQYVQAASNDAALAQIQSGQVDWTHNFVPNVAQAYSSKNPKHFHASIATTAFAQSLVFDDTEYPYSIPAFRKAVSLAIDRQSVYKLGEYGYAPAHRRASASTGSSPAGTRRPSSRRRRRLATYNPSAAKSPADVGRLHLQGQHADRPEGQPGQARHPCDLGLVGLGRLGPDHREEPAGHRDRLVGGSRARLELVVSERVDDEDPDAALAERFGRYAVRLLQRQPVPERSSRPSGQDATVTSNWAHFYDTARPAAPDQWQVHARHGDAEGGLRQARQPVPQGHADRPDLPRAPQWSTYSTEYFHGFYSPKNYYGEPIFTHYPGQHPAVHPDCSRAARQALNPPGHVGGRSQIRPPT